MNIVVPNYLKILNANIRRYDGKGVLHLTRVCEIFAKKKERLYRK